MRKIKINRYNNLGIDDFNKIKSDKNNINMSRNTFKTESLKTAKKRVDAKEFNKTYLGFGTWFLLAIIIPTLAVFIWTSVNANIQDDLIVALEMVDAWEITYEEAMDAVMYEWDIDEELEAVTKELQIEEEIKDLEIEAKEEHIRESRKFDLDKLAYAVAMQETKNCTLWYWATHNNCFWIKHWNTVPCPWVSKMAMCKFDTPEESYEAFKIIWSKWYWELPTREMAVRWSWNDRADYWWRNVLYIYDNK